MQDRWTIKDLTINAGLRWDRQRIIDASGVTQIDLKKDYAPRLGLTWDPSGSNKSKVFASYGRYYEEIPMDLVIRSFSYERQPRIINYSPTSVVPDANAEHDADTSSAILGGFTEPADPHLKNQYLTEVLAGAEREVMPNVSVGVKGIYRKYGRVIEDFLCSYDGTYCIGNPGQGIMKDIFTLDYSRQFPAPKPKRTFKGIQLDANKSFSNNWQGMASYVYSRLEGNYDGEYAPFTNVGADPNISAAYDYYDFFTNGSNLSQITNRGDLSNDRHHQLKASGIYNTPWKLNIGVSAYWRSGTPSRATATPTPTAATNSSSPRAAPKAAPRATTTPTSTSATRSRSAARSSTSSSTSSTSSTRNAPSSSINATASRRATTGWGRRRTPIT